MKKKILNKDVLELEKKKKHTHIHTPPPNTKKLQDNDVLDKNWKKKNHDNDVSE